MSPIQIKMSTIRQRIIKLEGRYGSLREVSRVTGIDNAYLCRLKSGKKSNPSDKTLEKLGLFKVEFYCKYQEKEE